MKIIILDCETTVDNEFLDAVGDFKASPFSPKNYIVEYGVKRFGTTEVVTTRNGNRFGGIIMSDFFPPRIEGSQRAWKLEEYVLVGHNIKFDLLYMFKTSSEFRETRWPRVKIWDTMLAEYLITGQSEQYSSLDKCAVKYGGVLKDNKIKEYWDAGVKTQDIPHEELTNYLKGDVMNTEIVFTKQMERIKKLGIMPLALTQMSGLKATVEMEWNGMHFNKQRAMELGDEAHEEMACIKLDIKSLLNKRGCYNPYFVEKIFNINSAEHLATALCGGAYEYSIKTPELDAAGIPKRYKSGLKKGEIRRVSTLKMKHTEGLGVTPSLKWTTPSGKMGVGGDVLKEIIKKRPLGFIPTLCSLVLQYRALAKDYKTYYVGYSDLTWQDNCIHPTLSHVGTDTGRLSCSKPNLQNATQTEDH